MIALKAIKIISLWRCKGISRSVDDNACACHGRALLITLSLCLLASCSTQGDFGRERTSVYKDEILPSIRNFVAESKGKPVTRFSLTEKERLLRTYHRRIGRDMSYPTVESYYTSTVASMGLTELPLPHLGEEIRSHENSRKPVVDVPENAKVNPYALKNEIEEDILLIRRVSDLSLLVIADDAVRQQRLAAMQSVRPSDRDNVSVRRQENLTQIKYIQHVAKLRVRRYRRVIEVMSIADPTLNLETVRALTINLRIEVNHFIRRQLNQQRPNPAMLLKTA